MHSARPVLTLFIENLSESIPGTGTDIRTPADAATCFDRVPLAGTVRLAEHEYTKLMGI